MLAKLKKVDWFIVLILFIFMFLSTAVIYSATISNPDAQYHHLYIKNVIFYGLGLFGFFVVTIFDYRLLIKIAPYLYGFGIVLLIAVYKFAPELNHARSWFKFAGISFQPAELVKVLLIISLAAFLARRNEEPLRIVNDIFLAGLLTFVPFVLVLIQPDLGTAVIFLVIFIGMLWIGNIKYTHVLVAIVVVAGSMFLFIHLYLSNHDAIKGYLETKHVSRWADRIDAILIPQQATTTEMYQVKHATIAIGSGSLLGEGFLKGNSVHKNFVPYAYADSIFAVVGEEFGFVGSSILLLLYFLLIYRMIIIAIQSKNTGGSYIIIGIVSMFVIHIFENIGMLIGLMPLTGITLPFVSYGGSSLMINMLSMGLVMSIKVHRKKRFSYTS